jgi:hypothetical protein
MLQWGKDCEAHGAARDGLKTRRPMAGTRPGATAVRFCRAASLKLGVPRARWYQHDQRVGAEGDA